jgi:hypothetical protein
MTIEERVYRKLIHALLDRYPITQIEGKIFRFFERMKNIPMKMVLSYKF